MYSFSFISNTNIMHINTVFCHYDETKKHFHFCHTDCFFKESTIIKCVSQAQTYLKKVFVLNFRLGK